MDDIIPPHRCDISKTL
ncbi:hypothetical protein EUTSA_v10016713mg, partial [Eutrema salsugineum]